MKENINEHDMTKKMMDIMRGGYKNKLITEADEIEKAIPIDDKDTLEPKKGDAVYSTELKKLQNIVDPSAEITNFKIYQEDSNVIIEGILLEGESENSGIKFIMNYKKRDIQTSMTDIELDDNVSEVLKKLKGYYENWVNDWAIKLTKDYPKKDNEN